MPKHTKQVRKKPDVLDAIEKYLKEHGWNVLVIGGTSVEAGGAEFNFIFRCKFTGKKIK